MDENTDIPDVIVHFSTGDMYRKGSFLGKGFFAKCYVITNLQNNSNYAAKIMAQSHASYSKTVLNEVSLQSKLNHKNVVKLHGFFEDCHFGYILLEICNRGCMQGLLRNRVFLTEPEVRYYMKQILTGIAYLHRKLIIHRDLKLGNLLLTNDLQVKIGDFGTAVQSSKGLIHNGICGTPNYIAPEVVTDTGHSFEFDIFSTGCVLYTLLLGIPPFQDATRERVFKRVEFCKYYLPTEKPSPEAKVLIQSMLQLNPKDRLTAVRSLTSQFMKGFLPRSIPLSSLTEPPQLEDIQRAGKSGYNLRRPLKEVNRNVPLTSVVDVKSAKKTPRNGSLKLKVELKNITDTRLDRVDKSRVSPKPDGSEETNPFNVSEISRGSTAAEAVGKTDYIFGGDVGYKDGQPTGRRSTPSNVCSCLAAKNRDHNLKLMNRLYGIPNSNVVERRLKIPCGKDCVEQNGIVAATKKEQQIKTVVACAGNQRKSPRSNRCEPTETMGDTNKGEELGCANEPKTPNGAKGKCRLEPAIFSTEGVNKQAVATTNELESSFVCTETSSCSYWEGDTSYQESSESNESIISCGSELTVQCDHQIEDLLLRIQTHLQLIINSDPAKKKQQFQADEQFCATTRVLRWQDYTAKYGFGYQLSNGSVGVNFNDGTNMLLLSDGINFCCATSEGEVSWYKMGLFCDSLDKKVRILLKFKKGFQNRQELTGETIPLHDSNDCSPYMAKQYKDSDMAIMLLTNETFQVDIVNENTKIIFCPGLINVIFINFDQQIQTIQFKSILENGCCPELARSFKYAFHGVGKIISMNDLCRCRNEVLSALKRKTGQPEEMCSSKKLKNE